MLNKIRPRKILILKSWDDHQKSSSVEGVDFPPQIPSKKDYSSSLSFVLRSGDFRKKETSFGVRHGQNGSAIDVVSEVEAVCVFEAENDPSR